MSAASLKLAFLGILALYLLGSLISLLTYKKQKLSNIMSNAASIIASISGILYSLYILVSYETAGPVHFSFKSSISLISISFNVDRLSAFFILVVSTLTLFVSIYSLGYTKHYFNTRNTGYLGFLYNVFILSMILVVTANHIFYFLVVWEIMSLVSYFLVTFENEKKDTQKAGMIYIIMTHIGTAFIIAAFALVYKYTGSTDFHSIKDLDIPVIGKSLIFLFSFIGFGTKAGIIPLHIWLPYAHPAAPSNVSALMSGVMIKTAIYGIIRVAIGLLGAEFQWWGTVILITGAVSTVLGVAYALMENNIKRLLAYSSIENIGIILIGVGLAVIGFSRGNSVLAAFSLTAGLFHTFNHSIFKGLLFLGAGSVHYSANTKNIEKLGGLIRKMPLTSVFMLVGILSISAIPPLNGFVGEWLTYQSLFINIGLANSFLKIVIILSAAVLALAGALAVYCFVKMYGIAFLAMPRSSNAENAREVPKTMLFSMGFLSLLCILSGIVPSPVIKLLDKVNLELLGKGIAESVKQFPGVVIYPVEIQRSSISPLAVFILALAVAAVVYLVVRIVSRRKKERVYGTWDCGYKQLNPRMQYTSTGFSKPIRIVFRAIYRPQRELQVEEGSSQYFFKSGKYVVTIQSVFEKYLYDPVIKNVMNFSRKVRLKVQTGSIHIYLIYIFLVIVAMFIYYAFA